MNVGNEQLVEEAVASLLRATRANDAQAAPARHPRQTDQCPTLARWAAVYKCGARWSDAERAHTLTCGFCLDVQKMFQTAAQEAAQTETVVGTDTSNETRVGGQLPKPGAE